MRMYFDASNFAIIADVRRNGLKKKIKIFCSLNAIKFYLHYKITGRGDDLHYKS